MVVGTDIGIGSCRAGDSCASAARVAQSLLLLDVLGKVAQGLRVSIGIASWGPEQHTASPFRLSCGNCFALLVMVVVVGGGRHSCRATESNHWGIRSIIDMVV